MYEDFCHCHQHEPRLDDYGNLRCSSCDAILSTSCRIDAFAEDEFDYDE